VSVDAAVARIGSDASTDVVIADPTVAGLHATLRLQGGVWMLEDHASDGGSWVDGDAVGESHPVAPGSVLRFGTVELVFDPQDDWADSPAMTLPLQTPAPAGERAFPAPLFMIDRAPAGSGWLPWAMVGAVVLLAVAAVLLAGGSR
jgi:pSer/pThr/pTyr-binding forkhead associated (FHA) protein